MSDERVALPPPGSPPENMDELRGLAEYGRRAIDLLQDVFHREPCNDLLLGGERVIEDGIPMMEAEIAQLRAAALSGGTPDDALEALRIVAEGSRQPFTDAEIELLYYRRVAREALDRAALRGAAPPSEPPDNLSANPFKWRFTVEDMHEARQQGRREAGDLVEAARRVLATWFAADAPLIPLDMEGSLWALRAAVARHDGGTGEGE